MYIECSSNNGVPYLRLRSNRPGINKQGKKVCHKETLLNIGPLSLFDDGMPDYLPRLRQSFKQGEPFIESLVPFVSGTYVPKKSISLKFFEGTDDCVGKPKNFSHYLLDTLFDSLGLPQLITLHKSRNSINYDLLGLIKMLCYSQLINPLSKFATFNQNDEYFGSIHNETNVYRIYDVLDVVHELRTKILRRMNTSITKSIGRDTTHVFYDVTNVFFEIPYSDDDEEIDGETVKGLRQRGVSKENRKSPIVQIGLFMDNQGIPISFEIFPGNTLDQATLRPALSKTMDTFDVSRYILVADRGLCSYKNIAHLLNNNHGYIISKSVKKTMKKERDWVIDDHGFIEVNEGFKYKSRILERVIENDLGEKIKVKEKVVVYWSKKFYDKEYLEHASFLEFVDKLKNNPENFRITKTQGNYLKKFLKKEVVNVNTGEVLYSQDLMSHVDEAKLEEFTAYMGYYQIVTSELEMDELEVIETYHGLSRIEDQFRVMKSDLNIRPIRVSTREHIEAHITICIVSLIMLRLIQHRILKKQTPEEKEKVNLWSEGLSVSRIQAALNDWQVDSMPSGYFRFNNTDNKDLITIFNAFGITIEKKLYQAKELREFKKKIS